MRRFPLPFPKWHWLAISCEAALVKDWRAFLGLKTSWRFWKRAGNEKVKKWKRDGF